MDNQIMFSRFSIMEKLIQPVRKLNTMVLVTIALFFSTTVLATDIAQKPLFLDSSATPNIMFILDDSGSMDWDILTLPHFEAYNYDRDANRSWARGGWLNWEHPHNGKRSAGDWVSYAGYCNDKNADGICHDELDLNGDGDKLDHEITGTTAIPANYTWHLRLKHLYHWNYPQGYCKAPTGGNSDASDFLPKFDAVLAFITGSKSAMAHTYVGTNWGSVNPYAGMTNSAYDDERWQHSGSDTFILADPVGQAAAEAACLAKGDGSTWNKYGAGRELIHQGSDPWHSAGTITNTTAATQALAGYTPGDVGNFHQEEIYHTGTGPVAAAGNLDINGDGATNTPVYYERDDWGIKRVNYHYLDELEDNVYRNKYGPWGNGNHQNAQLWLACGHNGNYSSVSRCDYLQYWDFPNNYAYNATATAPANSPWLPGNEKILELPAYINRIIQPAWPNPPGAQIRFDTVTWAPWSDPARGISNRTSPVGTRQALNKWDKWPVIADWRIRSSSLNVLYYSPTTDYKPWPGLEMPVSSFTAARSNPEPGSIGFTVTKDLSRSHPEVSATEEGGFVYAIWHDDAGFWSNKPQWHPTNQCKTSGWSLRWRSYARNITDPATGHVTVASDYVCSTYKDQPNGIVDLWDTRDRVTVYTNKIVVQTVRRTPHIQGEESYTGAGDDVFMSDTRVSNTVTYNVGTTYPVDGFCETVLGIDPANTANCRSVAQVQKNVATWYEFSRRRSFVAKGAIASLIKTLPGLHYGLMGTSRSDTVNHNKHNATNLTVDISKLFKDVYDGKGSGNGNSDQTVHNQNIRTSLYDYVFRASGTPLRQALQRAGEYFAGRGPLAINSGDTVDHNTSPITESCQKNFAIMLTDGYWSGLAPATVSGLDRLNNTVTLNDSDGDGYTKKLSDVAKYYYDEDLSTTLVNRVPIDSFDKNNAQHLSTIGIGFGVTGNLKDTSGDGWPGTPNASGALPYTEASNWGNPNNNPRKIDDLWHAAYNSRGLYLNAKNPAELIQRLNSAILFATATVGSASAVSANSHALTSNTRIYQTSFKSGDWTGDVKSFSLNTTSGLIITPADWTAQSLLDGVSATNRKIFTLGVANAGIPFRWTNLVDASTATASVPDQKTPMKTRWATGTVESDAFGQAQLNYLRGAADPQFRSRAHKLGDIVHSEPLYVDEPRQIYPDTWPTPSSETAYSVFRTAHNNRTPMLYVGANDGMLHAFDAATGAEKYAYIPRVLIPNLNSLSHKSTVSRKFEHHYFVDDAPTDNDVFFNNAWHTVLVGGLRGGGKGIYALDVTTVPTSDNEATIAGDKGLWEFTDTDDADMGYSFSKPSIVRLNNGKWAAIFGNGYNSANGKAVLYIVEFDTGSAFGTVHKFDTKVGNTTTQNGLSTPTVIDTNGDMIADRVYAGDLLGNVWAFDISSSNDNQWKTRFGTTAAPLPLFTATDGATPTSHAQPITAKIAVEQHPLGAVAGYLLHFGTGKFFSSTDNTSSNQNTQSVYAIWDYGTAGVTRSDLLQQTILAEVTHASGATVRVTSNNVSSTSPSIPIRWLTSGRVGDTNWTSNIDRKGWRMDLINTQGGNTDNKGERVISSIVVRGKATLFSTLLPATDACSGGGSGWLMALNKSTGARFDQTLFDISGDHLFNNADNATWSDGTSTHNNAASGVKSKVGIPSIPILLNTSKGYDEAKVPGSLAKIGGLPTQLPPDKGRKSWIQVDN